MSDDVFLAVLAGSIGFVSGFLSSIPTGPISITIINEGARRGFGWAAMIGFGAIVMDFIYCAVAFAGFSGLFSSELMRATMELLSFLATLYLGIKYLVVTDLPATTKSVEAVEHKLHPHTAFMIGFVRVLGNPAVLLFWITLSATFISHRVVDDTFMSKSICVLGMSTGAFTWFVLLAYIVSRGHGRFSTKTLVRMSHVSGAALLVVSLLIGIRLIKLLSESH
jgi:threonine/homoserine/homoserine lactone efflux protein